MTTDNKLTSIQILKYEFDGEPNSFLFQLRANLVWDNAAFFRLITAMYKVADEFQDSGNLPKWLAQGFWYVEWFTKSWITHDNFPALNEEYHTEAIETLGNLSHFLFVGEKVEIDFNRLKALSKL